MASKNTSVSLGEHFQAFCLRHTDEELVELFSPAYDAEPAMSA